MRADVVRVRPLELTKAEQDLAQRIEFDLSNRHDPAFVRENGETVLELMRSLMRRKAIPAIRLRVFTDPELFIGGRGSSHLDVFRRNGAAGDDVFQHPHFLRYLRYFLFGPDLPLAVIEEFCQTISECAPITSGDTESLSLKAKDLTRRHRLEREASAEAFYRLALECDLDEGTARIVRDNVKRSR